jgi:predicted neuraminidase
MKFHAKGKAMKSARTILAVAMLALAGAGVGAAAAPGLVSSELIFERSAELPSSHGSSVASMPDGSIMAVWYSGSQEAARDVAIWGSRLVDGQWSKPVVVFDTPDKPEGNPALFVDRSGKVWMFFVTIHGLGWNWCKIKYIVSTDSGYTWSPVTILRDRRGWMTRNHPLTLKDGRLLLPLYSENLWATEFMISNDDGKSWQFLAEVKSKPGNIQAAVVELDDGSLYSIMRTGAEKPKGKLWESRSHDGGRTWSPASETVLPNPNAGADMIRLQSGRLLLAFNNSAYGRSPLSLAVTEDGGKTWRIVRDVENEPGKEFSYPSLCQAKDGVIHLTYTYRREAIKHVAFTEEWLK